jgi:hypothetical protein
MDRLFETAGLSHKSLRKALAPGEKSPPPQWTMGILSNQVGVTGFEPATS